MNPTGIKRLAFAAALAAATAALPAASAGGSPALPMAVSRWTADVSDARPYAARVMRGASHRLEAGFAEGRRPVAVPDGSAASLLWQTNGMGDAWWSAPAGVASNAVSAVWTPEMDCGAPLYRAFLRVDAPGGADYSAFATLLMVDSPGAVPNELPLPARRIDFAAVECTNAPWALPSEVEAAVAAATNAIPAPDLSAYLRKAGGTLAGDLHVGDASDPALDGCTIDLNHGYGNVTVRTRKTSPDGRLWLANYNGDAIEVMDGQTGMDYRLLRFPASSGTLALESAIPATPVYAEDRPYSISVSYLAPADYEAAYAVTNGDTAAVYIRSGTYADAQCAVAIEDRPAEYAYEAPAGTWSIASDPAGAAAGIGRDGYLEASRTNSGTVVVEFATPSNGSRRAAGGGAPTAPPPQVDDGVEIEGTARHTYATNVLARFAAVDYGGPVHWTANPYSTKEREAVPDALCPYDTFGRSIPTGTNPAFFWPSLMESLLCCSVQKTETMGVRGQQILCVSPHFGLAAKHFGEVPPSQWTEIFCTNYAAAAFQQVHCVNPRIGNPANDLALVRFREALPPQCIAKLLPAAAAAALSPSMFDRAVGINWTQHGSIVPFVVGKVSAPWRIDGYGNATNAVHVGHVGDSGHAYGMVTPGLKFIPLGCLKSVNGGPSLVDEANQAWIEGQISAYGEHLSYYTTEELANE